MLNIPRLRMGLIGCGAFGESHLATYAGIPFIETVAITDVVEEKARKLAARYRVRRVAKDFREVCSSDEVDAVSVVTTEDQHLEPVLAALENHKHVFVEKPMATRVQDAQKMIEAARKSGVVLMPGHVLRFETKYATVKEQLDTGRLGRVLSLYARRNRPKWQGTVYKRTPLYLETAIHDLDAMLWYTGQGVQSVRSYEVTVDPKHGADLACGMLRFDGGAIGLVQTSWLLPDKTPFLDDSFELITTSGVANIEMAHSGLTLWREEGAEIPDVSYEPRLRGAVYGALREELIYFALCALEKRQPTVLTAEDGLEAVRVALALAESARTGEEVTL
ncbi:MAG: Gfo/Idh/MocA family oxidoreductase [Candidatus Omnitrophica bacterium]|nr:Gfo/Idh/MocA family oxidoreductase [Candidatus Omnitrophota bacterium]